MDKLTSDILTDIILRVPYKSTCCCKCISMRWRDLFCHPGHRKKLPLYGFFHEGFNMNRFPRKARYFTNYMGKGLALVDPSLPFLPKYERLDLLECCNGLLLCRCWKATDPKTLDYVVCNPTTEKWVVVPATNWSSKAAIACLGFEPTVSSHFHVFEFIDEEVWGFDESELCECDGSIETLAIYSSKAGVWNHHSLDNFMFAVPDNAKSVFFNGILHLATSYEFILAVDVEGNDWWQCHHTMSILAMMQFLYCRGSCISQTKLLVLIVLSYQSGLLRAIIVKNGLKHNVSKLEMFGAWYSSFANHFNVISFHPEHNMIFIVCGHENTLMSYDMDHIKPCFLCQLGRDCQITYGRTPYLPYVPLFSEALSNG